MVSKPPAPVLTDERRQASQTVPIEDLDRLAAAG